MTDTCRIINYIRQRNLNVSEYIASSQKNCYHGNCEFEGSYRLLNWDEDSQYHSEPGYSWVKFDFIRYSFFIEYFSLLSSYSNRDMLYWKLEGSTDGYAFNVIYTNNGEMICPKRISGGIACDGSQSKTFAVTPGNYKSIRMETTGISSFGDNYFVLRGVEFLGRMNSPTIDSSCKSLNQINLFIFFS